MKNKYFGTDGIRGKVNQGNITGEKFFKFGLASGTYFKNQKKTKQIAVIAKDTRLSGYTLEPALVSGLVSGGMHVFTLGPLPTNGLAMLTKYMRANMGIMITASHNPYYDNGLKLFGPDGMKLSDKIEKKIEKLIDAKNTKQLTDPKLLAHNYQTPEIYHGVADISADSLALAVEASKTKADKIIMCGVHFMAETAKLMCPEKKVFLPDMQAGCSLSNSITGEDVKLLKQKFPGVPVVSYVNTSADVKAETDVCCTSANAVKVVESLNVDKVIFLPDQYLADYVAKNTKVKIISWKGTCIVHEQFTGKEIEEIKSQNPGIKIIAHPECPPDVIAASDFAGSTSGMINYVKIKQPKKVMLVTECSMSDNVEADNPKVSFIKPCNLCPYMKKINLKKILDCLENETNEIILDSKTIEAARKSVIRMTEIGR